MGRGKAHGGAAERAASAQVAKEGANSAAQQLGANPKLPEDKTVRQRLWDFLEHGLFIAAITTVGALVGFFYTPILVACGLGILLAFHRAGVVRGYRKRVRVGAYFAIFAATTLAMYGAYRAIKDHLPTIPTAKEIASAVVSQLPQPQQAKPAPQASAVPRISPIQMEEIKSLSDFIGEPDEMSLRKEFGFPEMMDTNIRAIINNLHRWRRTGQLSH